jgi:enoyl-CoA hydratase/carnithine racemase
VNDFIKFETNEGIAILTLNSPETRNTLSSEREYGAIESACRRIQADRSIKAAILTANGKAFCAGGNIKDMLDRANSGSADTVERTGSAHLRARVEGCPSNGTARRSNGTGAADCRKCGLCPAHGPSG